MQNKAILLARAAAQVVEGGALVFVATLNATQVVSHLISNEKYGPSITPLQFFDRLLVFNICSSLNFQCLCGHVPVRSSQVHNPSCPDPGEERRGDACDDVRSNCFRQALRANRLAHRWCRYRRCHCVLDDWPYLEQ